VAQQGSHPEMSDFFAELRELIRREHDRRRICTRARKSRVFTSKQHRPAFQAQVQPVDCRDNEFPQEREYRVHEHACARKLLDIFSTNNTQSSYTNFPQNCLHARIAYHIYDAQGNGGRDVTAIGRKIKKMYIMVS